MKLEELGRERDCVRWYGQEFRALVEGTGIYKLPRSGLLEQRSTWEAKDEKSAIYR